MVSQHALEVAKGKRFEFGKNWQRFLSVINDERIEEAEASLERMLDCELDGKRFLDIGCGSGLFSLAARRLGATVCSFDYDPKSVACATELRRRYYPDDPDWRVEEGSVLDEAYVRSLGQFDVVYSWGVLHHTGEMWRALEHVCIPVANSGRLFIAIYNDQRYKSNLWRWVKKRYCSGPVGKVITVALVFPYFFFVRLALDVIQFKNPLRSYIDYKKTRGMSMMHDWVDWLGGYPYEVAKAEELFEFYRDRRFQLVKLKTTNSAGNNEFLFRRDTKDT